MPTHLKKLVRSRMEKTGESYATALRYVRLRGARRRDVRREAEPRPTQAAVSAPSRRYRYRGTLRHDPAIDAALAAFEYRFPIDRLIQRFKFAGDLALGRWLGEQLAASVAGADRPDLLVAPPLSRARLRSRGFNQALELARVVASSHRIALAIHAVEKVRDTPPQPGLGRRERQNSVGLAPREKQARKFARQAAGRLFR